MTILRDDERQLTIEDIKKKKPLLQNLDSNTRYLRDELDERHLEIVERLTKLEGSVSEGLKRVSYFKSANEELKREMRELKAGIKELRRDVSGMHVNIKHVDMKAIEARLRAFETKICWYLTLFGISIAVILGVF